MGVANSGYGGLPIDSIHKIHAMMKDYKHLQNEVKRLKCELKTDIRKLKKKIKCLKNRCKDCGCYIKKDDGRNGMCWDCIEKRESED